MTIYEIVITEMKDEIKLMGVEWACVTGNVEDGYQYTPEIEKTVSVKREIYKQNTEELDLLMVIAAINGLDVPSKVFIDERSLDKDIDMRPGVYR